jgi:hypothetical protein
MSKWVSNRYLFRYVGREVMVTLLGAPRKFKGILLYQKTRDGQDAYALVNDYGQKVAEFLPDGCVNFVAIRSEHARSA